MAPRGPKPEPASVKLAKGNPGHRPIGDDAAAIEGGEASPVAQAPATDPQTAGQVQPPKWLKRKGLEVWQRLAPQLTARRLLSQIDAETFGRYCRNFARWHKMQALVDRNKEFYESESAHGKLWRIHPAFSIAERLEKNLFAAEDRFGLNPAERQRIFASRASAAGAGDLFGGGAQQPARRNDDAAPSDADQSRQKSAIGALN